MSKAKIPDSHAIEKAASIMNHAADATRLRLLYVLREGEVSVNELCNELGSMTGRPVSQPAVSHHLALLRIGGVVVGVRDGKNVGYTLTDAGRTILGAADVIIGGSNGAVPKPVTKKPAPKKAPARKKTAPKKSKKKAAAPATPPTAETTDEAA
jgi:DNA-binding transcriptional ArsR family regulator